MSYVETWNREGLRQEGIMQRQVQAALNSFTREYARIYKNSAINMAEGLLFKKHKSRIMDILETRYKFIIPFFSKLALDDFSDQFTKAEQDVLISQEDKVTSSYILNNADFKSSSIANTSVNEVRKVINKGVLAGDSIAVISRSIAALKLVNATRSALIARTEVHAAANYGGIETARNAQREFDIVMTKEWLAVGDSRTRDPHKAMDGTVTDLDENFNVNGDMMDRPLDATASLDNIINCRCTLRYRKKEFKID